MPSLSDTQLIRTFPPTENRLSMPPEARAPLHLLGEVETLTPFNRFDVADPLALPRELWLGKRVLIAPGYGNLPFQLHFLGAGEVIGVDIDPLTIAYQRKKAQLGPLAMGDERLTAPMSLRHQNIILERLYGRLEAELPPKNEALTKISFFVHDLQISLPDDTGTFSLIVVPYLIGMKNGAAEQKAITILHNLSKHLDKEGALVVLPAAFSKEEVLYLPDLLSDFCHLHAFELSLSPAYPFPALSNMPGSKACYGVFRRQGSN